MSEDTNIKHTISINKVFMVVEDTLYVDTQTCFFETKLIYIFDGKNI